MVLEGSNGNTGLAAAEQLVVRGIDKRNEEEVANVGIEDGPVLKEAGAPGVEEVDVAV